MAYTVIPEPGETVYADIELNLSSESSPFHFAVSDRAVYIPRVKWIAKTDPYYFERVPLDEVRHVEIRRLRPYALWLLAGLMIVSGLISTVWMMLPVLQNEPSQQQLSGWPSAVFVGGFLVPYAARRRYELRLWLAGGRYRWKPPLVVDGASKLRIAQVFQTLVEAFEKAGISPEAIAVARRRG